MSDTTTRTEWAVLLSNGRRWTSELHTEASTRRAVADSGTGVVQSRTVTTTVTDWVDAPDGAA
jgi:hypothetical protein